MRIPTLIELAETLEFMKSMAHDGIPGVLLIDSGKPGPIVGITACTHGNEPSGLAAIRHLLREENPLSVALLRGKVFLVVNNPEAATAAFKAPDGKAAKKFRALQHNMNRLPKDLLDQAAKEGEPLEFARARQLASVWKQFEIGFDIHSTFGECEPMIITGRGAFHRDLVRGFPMKTVLTDIDIVQVGVPVFYFMGGPGSSIPVFEIEAGTHQEPESFGRAMASAIALLQNLHMIDGETTSFVEEYDEYHITGSVMFPDHSYKLARDFGEFERIAQGTVFGESDRITSPDLVAKADCHAIFGSGNISHYNITEEIMFLSDPVRKLSA